MQQMRAEATRRRDAAALQYGVLHETPQEDALVRMYVDQLSRRDPLMSDQDIFAAMSKHC